ncbi:MAG: CotH kinase family protein [Pseudomonadota bacterium]
MLPTLLFILCACTPIGIVPHGSDSEPFAAETGLEDTLPDTEIVEDTMGVALSVAHGFFEAPFDLVLTVEEPGATLRFTTDASDPRTSARVQEGTSPVTVTVDPFSDDHRDPTPGFVLRAYAVKAGKGDGAVITATYLFPAQVCALSPDDRAPGEGWPEPYETDYYRDSRVAIDYGMDRRVCDDPAYADLIVPALVDVPTLSLVTDLDNLFDEETGIYTNPMGHGEEWERPVSLELLEPEGLGFQIDAGLRIRGGWSRWAHCPKRAWRLFFRGEYGETKLNWPLFGAEGAEGFDTFDLRTSMNYAWAFYGTSGEENTLTRDVFSRDAQRELGRPYTRSRYYHLYLDGVYWGVYQSQERAEASFAATYLGGEKDAYDVVKVDGDDPTARVIEATDGTLEVWEDIWNRCQAGFESDEDYEALQGNTPDGTRDPELPVLVDVDNLIDYMLVIFWTGNFDAPTGAFTGNKEPNNFYAIRDRSDVDHGFTFYAHDSEHSLLVQAWSPGVGLTEDRVNIGTRADSYQMNVASFPYFHPQWLHEKLTANARYRTRFAARAAAVLQGDGPLTGARTQALAQARADELSLAIVAESARWGDSKHFTTSDGRTWRTRDDDWIPAVARITEQWCPARTAIVIEQLRQRGLWEEDR